MKLMKNIFLIFCLAFSFQALAQSDTFIAMQMDMSIAKQYLKKYKMKSFTVDAKGVFRPAKGYHIAYIKEKKYFIIKPKGAAVPQITGKFDVEPVPGGTMFCLCGKAADDCKINVTLDSEDTLHYFCDGGCGCGDFIIYDTSDPVRVQTANGEWNDRW
jgi:hypothetical protein